MLSNWQTELVDSFTDPNALLQYLNLAPDTGMETGKAASLFAFRVTQAYASRIKKGDRQDPLLRQVIPNAEECREPPDFLSDPVGDLNARLVPGLLQKYRGRVLLITTGACAIHCRYCFRRNFPYGENLLSKSREQQAMARIAAGPDIHEVILSGGDPWTLSDEQLATRMASLSAIPHVKRLRIHTRMPLILPNRVTDELLETLASSRLQRVIVIHVNHPQELDASVARGLARLSRAGCHLLNQSVLLRGVNDTAETLIELSEKLFDMGVLPYYIHLLDKAKGVAHFDVPLAEASLLMHELRRQLPGYLVPKLVREDPGQAFKTALL